MSQAAINWVGYSTIVQREITRIARIWIQTLVPPAITMTLYFVIFGALIGPRIGDMGGFDYMQYIAPGLIMMSVISNSYGNVVSSFFGAKFARHVEEMMVAPLPPFVILAGYLTGGVVRGLLVGVLVSVVAMFFTDLQIQHPWITLSIVFLTAIVFSLAGFINAVYAKNFEGISVIPTFILTPLTYLGGVFYSINLLSPFWQNVSKLNPILYMVNGFRYGFLGVSDISIGRAYLITAIFILILSAYSLHLLRVGRGLRA